MVNHKQFNNKNVLKRMTDIRKLFYKNYGLYPSVKMTFMKYCRNTPKAVSNIKFTESQADFQIEHYISKDVLSMYTPSGVLVLRQII